MNNVAELFDKCHATILLFQMQTSELRNMLVQIEKQTANQLKNKIKEKTKKDKREKKEKRVVSSGIQCVRQLSDALCDFLNVEHGTQLSRPTVTKLLNEYIKKHELYSKEEKRLIADQLLSKLLGNLPDDFVLTYFTIQKCMNSHFL